MAHYGTLVEANVFFDNRLHNWDWDAASLADRTKAMNQATEVIDQFAYIDQKYAVAILTDPTSEECRVANLSQELEFPRGAINEVPDEIEKACYLIAKALLSGRDPEADLESLATKSSAYGGVRTTFQRDGNNQEHIAHLIPSPQAFNLLLPFMREDKTFTTFRV